VFRLTINTQGAVFDDYPRDEVARILRAAADLVEHQGPIVGVCRDRYDNVVGRWFLVGCGECRHPSEHRTADGCGICGATELFAPSTAFDE
jgi:hypothetical protein